MKRAIVRKALADLRGRPLQASLLFLVIAAAAATLSLALNVQSSAAEPYERLREQSNGADLWLSSFSGRGDFEALERLPQVRAVSGPFPVSYTNYGLREGERKQQLALVGMTAQLPPVDHPVVTDGRWLRDGAVNELVLDRGAARRLQLEVGGQVQLLTPNGPETFTLVGFAAPAGRAPAPINDPAYAFVLPETLRRLEPAAVFGASPQHALRAGIQLADPSAVFAFLQSAGPIMGPFDVRTASDLRQNLSDANQFDVIFLGVFSLFALAASGLIIANAVGGQVVSQLRDIGILKALGFTPAQVTQTLLLQNLGLSILAGLAGVLAGLLVAPFFLERSADLLGVPAAAAFDPPLLAVTLLVVMALVTLFTLVPAWRAGRVAAVVALDASGGTRRERPSRLAALLARIGLPRVTVVGVKDLSRRPVRTLLTAIALVFAVVTATFSLGIEATLRETMADPTIIGGPPVQVVAERDAFPDAEARRIIEANPTVESYLAVYSADARIGTDSFNIEAYEGDLNNPRWAVREGRMPRGAGEAAVSTRLASERGLSVGQRVTVHVRPGVGAGFGAETPLDFTIVGRYIDAEGDVMALTKDSLPEPGEPTDYLIRTRPGTNDRAFVDYLIAESGGYLDAEVLQEQIEDIRDQWRPVLLGLNAVLFLIAGLNLLSSLLVSIRERRRDFAVLKTVGFTPAQLQQSVFSGSAALTLVAVAAGLPLGLLVTRVIFDLLSSAAGIGPGVGVMPGVLWLAPILPLAVVVAALATVLPARRAAAVQVAEALRYE